MQISTRNTPNPGAQPRITASRGDNRGLRGLHRYDLTSDIRPLTSLRAVGSTEPEAGFTLPKQRERFSAFTLIELLVVITIIIILAGLLFPAFNGAQNQAKKVQAKNDLIQIVTAINAFYTEYGKYPTNATTDANATYGPGGSTAENGGLFNELRGVSNSLNTRQIVFINPPNAKDQTNPRSGIKTLTGGYYDPWGTEYNVEMDADYTNQIETNPYPDTDGSAGPTPLRQGVISWSYGADQAQGTKGTSTNFKNSDDVISWQ